MLKNSFIRFFRLYRKALIMAIVISVAVPVALWITFGIDMVMGALLCSQLLTLCVNAIFVYDIIVRD